MSEERAADGDGDYRSAQDKASARRGALFIAGVFAVAIAVICGPAVLSGAGEPDYMNGPDDAEQQCVEWVKEKLKAPSTASFTTTASTGGETGPWTFAGTVDAENSFGAKIRNRWECEIRSEGNTWQGRSRVT